jgi:hypothetical protein
MNLLEEFKKFRDSFLEAAKDKRPLPQAKVAPINDPQFVFCNLWNESYSSNKSIPGVAEGVADFIKFKQNNPLVSYRANDTGFRNPSIFPGIKHAHITQDVSIFYRLEGANPRIIKMYGIFTHKQSGTGNTQNTNIQKSLTRTMSNQVFTSN